MERCWNKVGTALMTFSLTSLPIFQTQNVPNMAEKGPTNGPNRLKIAFLPRKLAQRAYFWLEGVKQYWNTIGGIRPDPVGPFFPGKCGEQIGPMALKVAKKKAKEGPNMIN